MCRSIKTLRVGNAAVDEAEVRAAALQFVRKVSGYRVPSERNRLVFEEAVAGVSRVAEELLRGVGTEVR